MHTTLLTHLVTALVACSTAQGGEPSHQPSRRTFFHHAPASAGAPNRIVDDIVVLIADDLGTYDLNHIATPNIDALAARGMSFQRAYSNSVCSPSRDSLLTGRWSNTANQFTCDFFPGPLRAVGDVELGTMLDDVGFETGYFGKWHHGKSAVAPYASTPHLFGWEEARAWNTDSMRAVCANNEVVALGGVSPSGYDQWARIDDGTETLSTEYNTDAIVEAFTGWLLESRGADPRAAVISFNTPHVPLHWPASQGPEPPAATDRDKYEAMVRDMDAHIGDLVATLKPDTWIIFVGDNGTDEKSRAPAQTLQKLKGTMYEGGLRVPMIFAGPGILPGSTCDRLVHFADVLPTLIEALGSSADTAHMQGRSLEPLIRDPLAQSPHDWIYCGCTYGASYTPTELRDCVVTRPGATGGVRWKLQQERDYVTGALLDERMFDLTHDPGETFPIAPSGYAVLDPKLVAKLRAWITKARADAER